MSTSGAGIFYDGFTSARHAVAVELGPDAVNIHTLDGGILAAWPFAKIAPLATPEGVLRIAEANSNRTARLEIRDAALAAALMSRAKAVGRTGLTDRRTRARVVAWSLAAVVSLLAGGTWGVPFVADRVAPHLPIAVEMHLGKAVDAQVRQALDTGKDDKPFECGAGPQKEAARAAFDKLVGTLESAAGLPLPLQAAVVRRSEANAIALPGGHVYLFEGLLKKANSVDEVAGVLGHEIGHVAHRDGTKSVLRGGGMSFLFGMLLGDFTGGGAVVVAAKVVLQSSNSREAEAAADDFGASLIGKVGGDPHALGAILERISGSAGQVPHFLLSHPEGKERSAAIEQIARPSIMKPLLTPAEWAALKNICS
jgi:predicted Zn-dependent protease